jgi:hypothetical protein
MYAKAQALFLLLLLTGFTAVAAPREIVIPAGTTVHFKLRQTVSTTTAKVGQHIPVTLTSPIVVNGITVAKTGASGQARISQAESSGRVGGSAKLAFSLSSITLANGTHATVKTSSYVREGRAHAKHNATYIATAGVIGALAGQAIGGNSQSTAKGAAIGAGVGIGAAAATGKFDFTVDAGDRFALKLRSSVRTTM